MNDNDYLTFKLLKMYGQVDWIQKTFTDIV